MASIGDKLFEALSYGPRKVWEGNQKQRRYEKKMALVHLFMGGSYNPGSGPGKGNKVSWDQAHRMADRLIKHPYTKAPKPRNLPGHLQR